ncbi:hydrogenase maturation protein HypF [Anopheles sinensis]|uniref:Hydrogenase maturation protein HypF n=1 Tax=Anopheles sinensis TaxID=74873 RepID=A0A084VLJ7_ANOSI|nr:hydrogenase maturation protein HypF [Anopheles sinensis]
MLNGALLKPFLTRRSTQERKFLNVRLNLPGTEEVFEFSRAPTRHNSVATTCTTPHRTTLRTSGKSNNGPLLVRGGGGGGGATARRRRYAKTVCATCLPRYSTLSVAVARDEYRTILDGRSRDPAPVGDRSAPTTKQPSSPFPASAVNVRECPKRRDLALGATVTHFPATE